MLETRRADACFINWGQSDTSARRHLGLLRSYKNHGSWILVRCLQRTQGLILSRKFADQFSNQSPEVETILNDTSLRWAQRNTDSGTERLLEEICASNGRTYQSLQSLSSTTTHNTERSAMAAVNTGSADITCGTQAAANEFQLPFVPMAQVSIDMVMTRRTYFRTLTQSQLNMLIKKSTLSVATHMGGYTLPEKLDVLTIQ